MLNITICQKDEITSSLKLEYYNNSKEFPIVHPLGMDNIGRLSSISLKDIFAFPLHFYINEVIINNCGKDEFVDKGRLDRGGDTISLLFFIVHNFYQPVNNRRDAEGLL